MRLHGATCVRQVVAALAVRGITDLSLVVGDPWSVHDAPCEGRLIQLFMYTKSRCACSNRPASVRTSVVCTGRQLCARSVRALACALSMRLRMHIHTISLSHSHALRRHYARSPDDNQYAHPLDLLPLVDLHTKRVVRIDQHSVPPPVPAVDNNYHAQLFPGPWRSDIKPLDVLQPEGPRCAAGLSGGPALPPHACMC